MFPFPADALDRAHASHFRWNAAVPAGCLPLALETPDVFEDAVTSELPRVREANEADDFALTREMRLDLSDFERTRELPRAIPIALLLAKGRVDAPRAAPPPPRRSRWSKWIAAFVARAHAQLIRARVRYFSWNRSFGARAVFLFVAVTAFAMTVGFLCGDADHGPTFEGGAIAWLDGFAMRAPSSAAAAAAFVEPRAQLASASTPHASAPSAPTMATNAAPSFAPPPTGLLLVSNAEGRAIYVDGMFVGKGLSRIRWRCGPHLVRVGSAPARMVNIPSAGAVVVD
jgi:hypothetical protein